MLFNSLLQLLPFLFSLDIVSTMDGGRWGPMNIFYRGWSPIGQSRTNNPPILCGYRINNKWSITRVVANIVNIVNFFSTFNTFIIDKIVVKIVDIEPPLNGALLRWLLMTAPDDPLRCQ